MVQKYYLDTCIWLNLFKKEGDPRKGKPYWEIADDFIRSIIAEKHILLYSEIILRELQIKLSQEEYQQRSQLIKNMPCTQKIEVLSEDKQIARQLESVYSFDISFYDLLNLVLAKRYNAVLVTRDKLLLKRCKENNVSALKPEELYFT